MGQADYNKYKNEYIVSFRVKWILISTKNNIIDYFNSIYNSNAVPKLSTFNFQLSIKQRLLPIFMQWKITPRMLLFKGIIF
jgi:hypothetical protein